MLYQVRGSKERCFCAVPTETGFFPISDGFRNDHQLSDLVVKLILLRATLIGKVALMWHPTALDSSSFSEWTFSVTGAILKLLVPTKREQVLGQ